MLISDDELEQLTQTELIQKVKDSLQEKNNLKYLLNTLQGISWEYDLSLEKFTHVSASATRILGYELDEWTDFSSLEAMIHEDDRDRISKYCSKEIQDGHNHAIEYRMVKNDGEVIWVLDIVAVNKNAQNEAVKLCGYILDVTQKKVEQLKVEKEHKFLETILNGITDPIMIINADYSVSIMNEVVKKSLEGRTFMEQDNPRCYEISHFRDTPCDGVDDPCPLRDVLESGKATTVIHNHRHNDGSDNFVELAASPLFDDDNNCIGIIESARNVNAHINLTKALQEKTELLSYEATHDHLTGLPNRGLFMDRLEQSIKDARRNNYQLALFFMDLDHFKEVNDTYGHHAGDEVLKSVTKKFQSCCRDNDILSRLAGDEFTLLLKDVQTDDDISAIASKFINIFKEGIMFEGNTLKLSVRIGISKYPNDADDADHLLQKADTAMYDAKAKGKNNFQFI